MLYPAFDLYPHLNYICIATSLSKGFFRRDPLKVVDEVEYWADHYRINNIAFYDNALLVEPLNHFIPMMNEFLRRGVKCNFHTPNALHIREIDEEVATLLYRSQFKTIRLGFETSNEVTQIKTGGKVRNIEFQRAVKYLKRAGYSGEEIGVYIMAGMPGQRVGEVEEGIAFVRETGASPILVEYSPIPQTPLFEKAKKCSQFDIEKEPLFQNNSIFPCRWEGFTMADYRRLKEKIKREVIG